MYYPILDNRKAEKLLIKSTSDIGRKKLFRKGELSFFVYGFAKSEMDNIDKSDERDFKELAKVLLAASDTELKNLIGSGNYVEVKSDGEG